MNKYADMEASVNVSLGVSTGEKKQTEMEDERCEP